jgi:hypothetical protein
MIAPFGRCGLAGVFGRKEVRESSHFPGEIVKVRCAGRRGALRSAVDTGTECLLLWNA